MIVTETRQTMSQNTNSADQNTLILKQVIPFMGKYSLSATPVNYTVIYEYYSGSNPQLNQTIDKALSSELAPTNNVLQSWFDSFLIDYDLVELSQTQIDMVQLANQLTEITLQTEGDISQFDGSLHERKKELGESIDNSSLASIVTELLSNTSSMQVAMSQMKQQLNSTKQEITGLQDRLEVVSLEAITDPLTGLMNRKGFMTAIEKAVAEFGSSESPLSLLILDIDHFKNINDTYGHSVGDKVIKVVADSITKYTRGKDTACRYGGEEYAVLLPETEQKGALIVAEKIRRMIETIKLKKTGSGESLSRMTISVGIASFVSGLNINDFIDKADAALYQSKNSGRNQCTISSE